MAIDLSNYKKLPRPKMLWNKLTEDEKKKFAFWDDLIQRRPFPVERIESLRNEIRRMLDQLMESKRISQVSFGELMMEYPEFFKVGELSRKIQPVSPLDEHWPDPASPLVEGDDYTGSEVNEYWDQIARGRYKIQAYRYYIIVVKQRPYSIRLRLTARDTSLEFLSSVKLSVGLANQCHERGKLSFPDILKDWGIYRSEDLGVVCEQLCQWGLLRKEETDSTEEFVSIFDLEKDSPEKIENLISN